MIMIIRVNMMIIKFMMIIIKIMIMMIMMIMLIMLIMLIMMIRVPMITIMILQFCNLFKRRLSNSRPEIKKQLIMKTCRYIYTYRIMKGSGPGCNGPRGSPVRWHMYHAGDFHH